GGTGERGRGGGEDQVFRRERAVALAQQDFPWGLWPVPGRGQGAVGQAVAVEVARHHRQAAAAVEDGGGDRRLERTVAVAQEHTYAARGGSRSQVDDGDVRLAVVVEVRHRDRAGVDTDRERDRGQESGNGTIFQCFDRQGVPPGRPGQRPGLL